LGSALSDQGDYYSYVFLLENTNFANLKIYAHPSMATINSGGVEGDLARAIIRGATVRYVTNFTKPNPVTSLSTGTITTTTVQINFTSPTGSTNTYDFSEVYVKNASGYWEYKSKIASGGYLTGLTTATHYDLKIVARDIYYNGTESFLSTNTN
jgi:hypothetical protein